MQISNLISSSKSSVVNNSNANSTSSTDNANSTSSLSDLSKTYTVVETRNSDNISNLTKSKQDISQMEAAYRAKAVKEGLDKETINAKMAEYDSRISQIDQKISQLKQNENIKEISVKSKHSTTAGSSKNSNVKLVTTVQTGGQDASVNQSLIKAFSSEQTTKDHIEAVQTAQHALQTEATYKPSVASSGDPGKYTVLATKADSLEADIAKIDQNSSKTADQTTDGSSQLNEDKTLQEKAVENYKASADGFFEDEGTDDTDELDLLV